MKTTYWTRLRDVITFLIIWIGVPYFIFIINDYPEVFAILLITWVPAMLVTDYLNGKE